MTSADANPPVPDGQPTPPSRPLRRPPERRTMRYTSVLAVSVAAFMLWLVLDAPTLQRNAQEQPLGARRTVSLDTLGPIALFSRGLQLSHVVSVADGLIGRGGGTPGVGPGPEAVGPSGAPAERPHTSSTAPAGGTVPTSSTTTTTVVPDRHPTPANPLRALIIGDSLGIDLGDSLQNDLTNTGVVLPTVDARESTGLARPDYFDWPAELQADMTKINPQVVVIMMGANDPQDFPGPPDVPYGTPQWNTMYRQRVAQFMQIASSNGAKVIWVGMPPMQDPGRNAAMEVLNDLVASEAKTVPGVTFLSSWHLLGGPAGQFTPYLVVDGQEVNVREPDGTHIAPGGGEVLSQAVMAQMHHGLGIDLTG